ncbi:hypothetical protein LCGC14_2903550 [marine sediment metagenome]|uniref:Uncharacterized protein n=1 Tax=marine sediment metagenome TaxID=412755 RepID=A0A0F8YFN6_9ZZZZ
MRNTAVLEVKGKKLSFWPFDENIHHSIGVCWWPRSLRDGLAESGIYVIRRTTQVTRDSSTLAIRGNHEGADYPASWDSDDSHAAICQRLLEYLGIRPMPYRIREYYFTITEL